MDDRINWDRVEKAAKREGRKIVWKPYGFPEVLDPFASAFVNGLDVAPRWQLPDPVIVSAAITGAFFSKKTNPAQPLTTGEIRASAEECLDAGASTVHIHVRDDRGYNILDQERFREVIEPLRAGRPDLAVDGCLVPALEGWWERIKLVLDAGLLDSTPVNTTAVYTGDTLFAKPIHVMLEKARLIQECGAKVQIAVYTDADVDNARRYLVDSGLVAKPLYWIVLPALPGCSPMHNPRQMIEGLTRMVNSIRDVDERSIIMVCAAGRASTYLTALALIMGLHVRVGMEDSVWLWPHRDDLITSNAQHVRLAANLVQTLGRRIATQAEYRDLIGLPSRARGQSDIARTHEVVPGAQKH